MIAWLARNETRRDILLLIGVCGLLYLPALGARDLWNPSEPIYGRAVVEMEQNGSWLVPTVNEQVFYEKPILFFWIARVVALIMGGVSETSLRLPGVLVAMASVLALYGLVRSSVGASRARVASLVFATLYSVFWSARMVQLDLLLTFFVLATIAALYRSGGILTDRSSAWWIAGGFVGLGVLAKGPLALLLPAAILFVRRPADIKRLLRKGNLLWFILAVVGIVAPWLLVLWATGRTEMFGEFFVRQHLQRFVDPWDHQRPFWYYLVNLPPDMAPWFLWLPLCVALPLRNREERALDRLAWVWLLVPFLIFSLSASKRSIYLLPTAPAVAILISGYVDRFVSGRLGIWRDRIGRGLLGFLAVVLLVAGMLIQSRVANYPAIGTAGTASALLMGGGGVVIIATLLAHGRRRALLVLTPLLVFMALYVQVPLQVLPLVNAYKSSRPFAMQVRERVPEDIPLRSYRMWKWRAGYIYYIDRTIPRIEEPQALQRYMARSEPVFLLAERDLLPEVQRVVPEAHIWVSAQIGSNAVHLLSNRPSPGESDQGL